MESVQMNVRIDREMKASGDAAFAEAGFTPSEAVRVFWDFARRNRRTLREFMDSLREPEEVRREREELARREAEAEAWVEELQRPIREFYEQFGIDPSTLPPFTQEDYERLEEEMYDEKYGKWLGLE